MAAAVRRARFAFVLCHQTHLAVEARRELWPASDGCFGEPLDLVLLGDSTDRRDCSVALATPGTARGCRRADFRRRALPTLGFVNTLYQDKSTVADHYLYLSMFGIALAIGAILVQCKSKPMWAAATLAVVACATLSFRQTSHWQNSYSLYQHATEVSPRSWAAHSGFAQALIEQKQLSEAEAQIRDAVEIFPTSRTYLSLGNILLLESRPADAVEPLQKALDLEPGFPVRVCFWPTPISTAAVRVMPSASWSRCFANIPTMNVPRICCARHKMHPLPDSTLAVRR